MRCQSHIGRRISGPSGGLRYGFNPADIMFNPLRRNNNALLTGFAELGAAV